MVSQPKRNLKRVKLANPSRLKWILKLRKEGLILFVTWLKSSDSMTIAGECKAGQCRGPARCWRKSRWAAWNCSVMLDHAASMYLPPSERFESMFDCKIDCPCVHMQLPAQEPAENPKGTSMRQGSLRLHLKLWAWQTLVKRWTIWRWRAQPMTWTLARTTMTCGRWNASARRNREPPPSSGVPDVQHKIA